MQNQKIEGMVGIYMFLSLLSTLCYFKHESVVGFHTLSLKPHCDSNLIKAQAEQMPDLLQSIETQSLGALICLIE